MIKKVLVATVGIRPWPVINSIWAAKRYHDYEPDIVYLIPSGEGAFLCAETVRKGLGVIAKMREHPPVINIVHLDGEEIQNITSKVKDIIDREVVPDGPVELSLDITAGRKLEVVGALLSGYKGSLWKNIFYLSLDSMASPHRDRPLVLIPATLQSSMELMGGRNS